MHVWNVLQAARWNTGHINYAKIAIAEISRAIPSQLRHVSTVRKKLLNSNVSSTCFHNMVNFGPLAAEIGSGVWKTPGNFNEFRLFASLLHRCRATEVNKTLHDVSPSPGLVQYTHFAVFCPLTEFCHVQNSLASKSCVLVYWQGYCMTLQPRVSAKLCGVVQPIFGWTAITLGIGPHSSWQFFASCIYSEPPAACFRRAS